MKDKIVLSNAEYAAARQEVLIQLKSQGVPMPALMMDAVIDAINKVRTGDPVGTVRVNGTSTAVRRPYGWLLIHPDHCDERNDERSPVDVSDWKVVHRP